LDWSDVMTELSLPQRVAKIARGAGLSFWLRGKWSVRVWVGLQTPGASCQALCARVRLGCLAATPGCKHLALGLPSPWSCDCQALGDRVRPARLAADPGKRVPPPGVCRPEGLRSAEPHVGFCVRIQFSWVRCQDPRFLGLRFLNILNCIINIIIFIIIKSIDIKNIIICLKIKSIDIKNIIIYLINIIIFVIINIFNINNTIICIINIIIFIIVKIINIILIKFKKIYIINVEK
jgi:hypothetical protein